MIHFSLPKAPGAISPCDPSPCGPNAVCGIADNNKAICGCIAGYSVGEPPSCRKIEDSCMSKGCGRNEICVNHGCQCKPGYHWPHPSLSDCRQCSHKSECGSNQTCDAKNECVDVCGPGVCGPNDECYVFNHEVRCRPKGSQPNCSSNTDCATHEACDGYKCVNPCVDLCDVETYDCKITNHVPTCTCKTGFYASTAWLCSPNGVVW